MWFGLGMPLLGTAVGACAALGMPMGSRRWNAALSGGAAGAMTAACVWNLLLPALDGNRALSLGGFALGFLALLLPGRLPGRRLSPGGALLLAVVLHNIPEGLAVGAGDSAGLTLGIALQNIPDGAVAAVPLLALGFSRWRAFGAGVLTGMVEPIAAGLMLVFAPVLTPWMPALLGFAAGAMLFVVMTELAARMGESGWGTVCFAIGFVLMCRN
ncbi:MAG: ZIP family metal transporter [Oscillospiraceae bacterium]|nr:ZIP family metal transporter [Oscillospiraceae bacterium]